MNKKIILIPILIILLSFNVFSYMLIGNATGDSILRYNDGFQLIQSSPLVDSGAQGVFDIDTEYIYIMENGFVSVYDYNFSYIRQVTTPKFSNPSILRPNSFQVYNNNFYFVCSSGSNICIYNGSNNNDLIKSVGFALGGDEISTFTINKNNGLLYLFGRSGLTSNRKNLVLINPIDLTIINEYVFSDSVFITGGNFFGRYFDENNNLYIYTKNSSLGSTGGFLNKFDENLNFIYRKPINSSSVYHLTSIGDKIYYINSPSVSLSELYVYDVNLDTNTLLYSNNVGLERFRYMSKSKDDKKIYFYERNLYILDVDTNIINIRFVNYDLNGRIILFDSLDLIKSGLNENFSDLGTYNNSFNGGFFNLGAKENFSVDLNNYFTGLDEWFILDFNGNEIYNIGDYFNYTLPFNRNIEGKTLTEEKEIFSVRKNLNNSFTIFTQENELLGFGLYGTALGIPFYNSLGQRIGTQYYNIGVQVIGGINRIELSDVIISQENRDKSENVYYINLFEKYSLNGASNLREINNIFFPDIKMFFSNPYQNLFSSDYYSFTFPNINGLNINNFVCSDFANITGVLCNHENNYFKLDLNRNSGILRIEDKGTLPIKDLNNKNFVITYQPSVYVGINNILVTDTFLDIGFIKSSEFKEEVILLKDKTFFDFFKDIFKDKEETTQERAFFIMFMVFILTIGGALFLLHDSPNHRGYIIPLFASLIVFEIIFFVFIGYIPIWILIIMILIGVVVAGGFIRKLLIGSGGSED